ncbi:MAG: PilZ domain-containing protein [Candidatus Omnitrophota bacterium]
MLDHSMDQEAAQKAPLNERRKHPRLKNNIPVKICSDDFDMVTETRNLSCAGAYCRVNKYLEPMTKLKIHLLLPFKRRNKDVPKKISCQGVIVRVESEPGDDYFQVAIYFSEMEQKDRKMIADYVDSTLKKVPMDNPTITKD